MNTTNEMVPGFRDVSADEQGLVDGGLLLGLGAHIPAALGVSIPGVASVGATANVVANVNVAANLNGLLHNILGLGCGCSPTPSC